MKPQTLLEAGEMCGPYEIEREIGRGGMGVVYLATGPDGEKVAIKAMAFASVDPQIVQRFKREIKLLATVAHSHVVRFLEAGEVRSGRSGVVIWLALEYLEGQTLRQIITERGGRLSVDDMARWAMQIADGLDALHRIHVVHRDLKPENVAVVRGMAVVFDLGVAHFGQWARPRTLPNSIVGTMTYKSPEEWDEQKPTARSDLFALGLILHEMATGHNPLMHPNPPANIYELQARAVLFQPPDLTELVPGFPPDLAAITRKALARDPEHRHASARELKADLHEMLTRHRLKRHSVSMGNLSADWHPPTDELVLATRGVVAPPAAVAITSSAALPGRAEVPIAATMPAAERAPAVAQADPARSAWAARLAAHRTTAAGAATGMVLALASSWALRGWSPSDGTAAEVREQSPIVSVPLAPDADRSISSAEPSSKATDAPSPSIATSASPPLPVSAQATSAPPPMPAAAPAPRAVVPHPPSRPPPATQPPPPLPPQPAAPIFIE